jgi:hypothetical protein
MCRDERRRGGVVWRVGNGRGVWPGFCVDGRSSDAVPRMVSTNSSEASRTTASNRVRKRGELGCGREKRGAWCWIL